jgi:hypothetical protein
MAPTARSVAPSPAASNTALVISFNEQRYAIGTFDNVLPDARGKRLIADDAVDQRSDFTLTKAIEIESGDVWSPDPRRLELRSIRDSQQHPQRLQQVHGPPKHFKAGRVEPMHVLENHQDRIGT